MKNFYLLIFLITFLSLSTSISMGAQKTGQWRIIKTTGNNNHSSYNVKSLPSKKVINSIANRETSSSFVPPAVAAAEDAKRRQEQAAGETMRGWNERQRQAEASGGFDWVNNLAREQEGTGNSSSGLSNPAGNARNNIHIPRPSKEQLERIHDAAVGQRTADAASDAVKGVNDRVRDSFRWGHNNSRNTSGSGSDSGFWGNVRNTANNAANTAANNAANIADANQRASNVAEDINDNIWDSFRREHSDNDNKGVPVIGTPIAGTVVPTSEDDVTVVNAIPPGGVISQLEPSDNPPEAQDDNQGNPDNSAPLNPQDNTADPNMPDNNQNPDNGNMGNNQGNSGTVNIPNTPGVNVPLADPVTNINISIPGVNALGSGSAFGDLPAPVNPYISGETVVNNYIPVSGSNYVGCHTAGVTADSFNVCLLNNAFINILINMDLGIADVYFMGNHMFRMSARYVDIPGFLFGNVIELQGNGLSKMYLIKSRRILYFRNGVTGSFADVKIAVF